MLVSFIKTRIIETQPNLMNVTLLHTATNHIQNDLLVTSWRSSEFQ